MSAASYWEPLRWLSLPDDHPAGLLDIERLVGAAGNNLYTVWVYELPGDWHHLSIRRFDKAACRDWRHFQWIKNEICGAEREAVEIFPAESRLLDAANQYHLWVLPQGQSAPMGTYSGRAVADEDYIRRFIPEAGQRKFAGNPDAYVGHVGLLERKTQ